jgi:hypothetical protein
MKRVISVGVFLFAFAAFVGVAGTTINAAADHTQFNGGVGIGNPCNGEGVTGTGPVNIVYVENGSGDFTLHLTFMSRNGVGTQGNKYVMNFVANEHFDAPTSQNGNVSFFILPVHAEVVSKGGAPNFEYDAFVSISVVNGHANGAALIGPVTTTCHGS